VHADAAVETVVEDEGRDEGDGAVRGHVGGAEDVRHAADRLLLHAQGDAEVVAAGLHHRNGARDFDQVRAVGVAEEVVLLEVADLHACRSVAPFEVVRADVGLTVALRHVGVRPGAHGGGELVRLIGGRAELHRHHARLGQRVTKAYVVGRVFEALHVAAQADLPRVAEARLHAEGGMRVGGIRGLVGDAGERDHLALEARDLVGHELGRLQHRLEVAEHVGRQRAAKLPDFLVGAALRLLLFVEAERDAMIRARRDDRGDGGHKALLHRDDLIDAAAQRREAERAVARAVGLDGLEILEVEGDDEGVRDRAGRVGHRTEDLQRRRQGRIRSCRRGGN
jgi:hypothetical protein